MDDFKKYANSLVQQAKGDLANAVKSKLITTPVSSLTKSLSAGGKKAEALAASATSLGNKLNLGNGVPSIKLGGNVTSLSAPNEAETLDNTPDTMRIRLRAQNADQALQVYGEKSPDNILSILHDTNGMLFPYTPSIDWNQSVEYAHLGLTHANQDFYSYKNTPSVGIGISGEFSVQSQREGEYLLAVIHFLRTVSKMYFGKPSTRTDENGNTIAVGNNTPGLPPPVLIFTGYGNYMFNELPVIVKSHSYSFGKEIDYVNVKTASGMARLPSLLTISLQLTVQNTPKKLREEFDLDKFRTGELMRNNNKGWI